MCGPDMLNMSQEKGFNWGPSWGRTVVKNLRTIPGISSSKLVFSGYVSRGHQESCNSVVLIWVVMVLYCLSLSRGERKELHEHISKSLSLKNHEKACFFQIVWNLRLTIYTCSKKLVDSFWQHRTSSDIIESGHREVTKWLKTTILSLETRWGKEVSPLLIVLRRRRNLPFVKYHPGPVVSRGWNVEKKELVSRLAKWIFLGKKRDFSENVSEVCQFGKG